MDSLRIGLQEKMMSKIREWLRQWRRYRLASYAQDQREYQKQSQAAADACMDDFAMFSRQAVEHARLARRAEIELEEMDNGRI